MMKVDGDPVVSRVQAVHSPDPAGRSVEVHTADMADDGSRVSAGLGDVHETPSRYEVCRVVWCAHIAATGSSTSSDGIALTPEGGPWRSFYRNAVIERKPFCDLFFSALVFSAGASVLNATQEAVRSATREREGELDVSDVDCGVCWCILLCIYSSFGSDR